MNKLDETAFVQEVCRYLDQSIANLPHETLRRLDEGRQGAVLQTNRSARSVDEGLAGALGRELDQHSAVPPEIEARLDEIRQRAVAKFEKLQKERAPSTKRSPWTWLQSRLAAFNFSLSAGMLATACVLLTAIALFYTGSRPTGTLTLEEEIGLVATAEDIELYENLEFYLWLAENESLTL